MTRSTVGLSGEQVHPALCGVRKRAVIPAQVGVERGAFGPDRFEILANCPVHAPTIGLGTISGLEHLDVFGDLLQPLLRKSTVHVHCVGLGQHVAHDGAKVCTIQATIPHEVCLACHVEETRRIPEILDTRVARGESLTVAPPLGRIVATRAGIAGITRQARIEEQHFTKGRARLVDLFRVR